MGVLKSNDGKLGINFYEASTTPLFALGQVACADNGSEFIYVKCTNVAIAVNNYCAIAATGDGTWEAQPVTAALAVSRPRHGVALVAIPLNNYGWLCTKGQASDLLVTVAANTLAGPSATNPFVQTTATAGVITCLATLTGGQVQLSGAQVPASVPAAAVATTILSPRLYGF